MILMIRNSNTCRFSKRANRDKNYTEELLDTAFGVNLNPTWEDFQR